MSDKLTSSSIAYNFVHGHTECYTDKQEIKELDAKITELNVSFANWLMANYKVYRFKKDGAEPVDLWFLDPPGIDPLKGYTSKELFNKFQKQK